MWYNDAIVKTLYHIAYYIHNYLIVPDLIRSAILNLRFDLYAWGTREARGGAGGGSQNVKFIDTIWLGGTRLPNRLRSPELNHTIHRTSFITE